MAIFMLVYNESNQMKLKMSKKNAGEVYGEGWALVLLPSCPYTCMISAQTKPSDAMQSAPGIIHTVDHHFALHTMY